MAHYAFLDENNVVTHVIVGKDENENGIDWEEYYGAKRTSYNTVAGRHRLDGTPFRKNYAGAGYYFDEVRDAFIAPKPYDSWVLNEETCFWEPPTLYPTDGQVYQWVEDDLNWQLVPTE